MTAGLPRSSVRAKVCLRLNVSHGKITVSRRSKLRGGNISLKFTQGPGQPAARYEMGLAGCVFVCCSPRFSPCPKPTTTTSPS